MKSPFIFSRPLSITLAIISFGLLLSTGLCRADDADNDTDQAGVQVLTRGPVHEAFAGVISFKPAAGIIVPKAPPEMIQEIPPDQKPAGDNVTWIPGYWAWDDERNDFLWVSGIWRALPPGRQWVAGYWAETGTETGAGTEAGYQWISGYWADANDSQTTYLPAPPASLEDGPDVAAPADDYVWVPGSWIWVNSQYAWQPGYWVEGQDDWDWNPDYYVWTPRGYVFVDGYWDYSIERRGVLFAPAYFDGARSQPGFSYTPSVVIDLGVLPNHLFLRPGYNHYYFGDYYDAGYSNEGFYVAFSFESDGYGYDPIFAHQRWQHRKDPNWQNHIQTKYQDRRDHKNVRPPRTWAAQKGAAKSVTLGASSENPPVATSFVQLAKQVSNPRPFQPLATDQKQQFVQRLQQVKHSRDMRRTVEVPSTAPRAQAVNTETPFHSFTVARPPSPIVSRPANLPQREQAPPRPPRNRMSDLRRR